MVAKVLPMSLKILLRHAACFPKPKWVLKIPQNPFFSLLSRNASRGEIREKKLSS